MQTVALGVGFGLVTGAILGLAAVGFTLQYAVSTIPNLAYGELLTYGAYAGYLTTYWVHSFTAEGLAAAAAGGIVSWAVNAGMIEPFVRARVRTIAIFIGTLAVSQILQNFLLLVFGGANVAYVLPPGEPRHVGPFLWTARDGQIMVAAFVVMLLLFLILQHTRFGKSLRAVSENRALARVSGIDAHRVVQGTWFLAGAVAGFAGFVLAVSAGTLTPSFGFRFLLVTVTGAVAGGLGKPHGAMAAALILGVAMEVSAFYVDAAYKLLVAFGILVLVLLFRPDGLFASSVGRAFE
jgi:branched-subunit amino acid ABC-type transport system permease component